MYAGAFRLTSEGVVALLRLDLLDDASIAQFYVTDHRGYIHEWQQSMLWDGESKCYEDRAVTALMHYLADCLSRGWIGNIELTQCGPGLEPQMWNGWLTAFQLMHCSTRKPEHEPLH
jgi:hypothetical protein